MNYTIFYDNSGVLVPNEFFELTIPFDYDEARNEIEISKGSIVGRITAGSYAACYCDVLYDSIPVTRCSRNNAHVLKRRRENFRADLFGVNTNDCFVADTGGLSVVVTDVFANRLATAGFVGIQMLDLAIDVNQSKAQLPRLKVLAFQGVDCLRTRVTRVPNPNICPFCKKAEVVCPQCLEVNYTCPKCERELFGIAANSANATEPFLIQSPPLEGRIIDGQLWDGADFIDSGDQGIVTRRVVDWLLNEGITSFKAKACRVDVTGMADAMLGKLSVSKE